MRALADRYRKGIPIYQDEVYYLSDITWNKPNFDLARDWPAGNLVRRYAIDLAGGLAGSLPLTYSQMRDTDVAHAGQTAAARFSWHFVPNERFVVSNMAGRHLEGATLVGKPALDARLNGFVFRAAAGYEFAILWAILPENACTVRLPKGLRARDVFGNSLSGARLSLTDAPVYLFGSDLIKKLPALTFGFEGETRFVGLTRRDNRYVARLANDGRTAISVRVRLSNAHAIAEGVVKPGRETDILLPAESSLEASTRLIVQDRRRVISHPVE